MSSKCNIENNIMAMGLGTIQCNIEAAIENWEWAYRDEASLRLCMWLSLVARLLYNNNIIYVATFNETPFLFKSCFNFNL